MLNPTQPSLDQLRVVVIQPQQVVNYYALDIDLLDNPDYLTIVEGYEDDLIPVQLVEDTQDSAQPA